MEEIIFCQAIFKVKQMLNAVSFIVCRANIWQNIEKALEMQPSAKVLFKSVKSKTGLSLPKYVRSPQGLIDT